MNWKHDDLMRDLAAHLRRNGDLLVWEDMQLGPAGSPRPDVYTIQKAYSRFLPRAYEIKISVADFRSDITSGKWQKYLKYAGGVIFAVPAGLIAKQDIPAGCGLMVRGEDGWRTVKAPTMQKIATLPHEAWQKLLIDGIRRQVDTPVPRPEPALWLELRGVRKRRGDMVASLLCNVGREDARLREKIADIEKRRGELLQHAEKERQAARANIAEAYADLRQTAKELGFPDGLSEYEIIARMGRLRQELDRDAVVKTLRQRLSRLAEIATGGRI